MSQNLLPGSELSDTLLENDAAVKDAVEEIIIGFNDRYIGETASSLPIRVDVGLAGTINAYIANGGRSLYILSDYDIYCDDCQMMFYRMPLLKRITFDNLNTGGCTNMHRMFMSCPKLEYVNMPVQSSAKVTDFSEMFSGDESLQFVDIGNFTLKADPETCNYVDMFKGTSRLRRIRVGGNFQFAPEMGLENPDPEMIPDCDGKWHDPMTGASYDASGLPGNRAATYYAIDVASDAMNASAVSFGTMREMAKQMAISVNNQILLNRG